MLKYTKKIESVKDLDKTKWEDCGTYWHYKTKQVSDDWHKIRIGRCSGTRNGSKYKYFGISQEQEGKNIAGLYEFVFSERSKYIMGSGVKDEPKARKYYENKYGIKVKEMGFCIPKNNPNLGCSIDGLVMDCGVPGIIEIKCPQRMYYEIKNYTSYKGYSHIKPYHYRQMQFNMGCLGVSFCDYVVFSRDGYRFVQRVPFDDEYWKVMYVQITCFWEDHVNLWIKKYNIEVVPMPVLE